MHTNVCIVAITLCYVNVTGPRIWALGFKMHLRCKAKSMVWPKLRSPNARSQSSNKSRGRERLHILTSRLSHVRSNQIYTGAIQAVLGSVPSSRSVEVAVHAAELELVLLPKDGQAVPNGPHSSHSSLVRCICSSGPTSMTLSKLSFK